MNNNFNMNDLRAAMKRLERQYQASLQGKGSNNVIYRQIKKCNYFKIIIKYKLMY